MKQRDESFGPALPPGMAGPSLPPPYKRDSSGSEDSESDSGSDSNSSDDDKSRKRKLAPELPDGSSKMSKLERGKRNVNFNVLLSHGKKLWEINFR